MNLAKDFQGRAAFLALGSNIEPRFRYMIRTLHQLHASADIHVLGTSAVYSSLAHTVDVSEEPDYLNAVVRVMTTLTPRALLDHCLSVERALGRERTGGERWRPRTIDIDILLYEDQRISSPGLTIPHPRLAERLFVLLPLRDLLGADGALPTTTLSLDQMIRGCPDRILPTKTILSLHNYA